MICAEACWRSGLRELGDVVLLVVVGRCGTAGITGVVVADSLGMQGHRVLGAFARLIACGLVHPATRDGKQGRPMRYTVTPAGLALLQSRVTVVIPAQQEPMNFSKP